jgi:hypothetical protein
MEGLSVSAGELVLAGGSMAESLQAMVASAMNAATDRRTPGRAPARDWS